MYLPCIYPVLTSYKPLFFNGLIQGRYRRDRGEVDKAMHSFDVLLPLLYFQKLIDDSDVMERFIAYAQIL